MAGHKRKSPHKRDSKHRAYKRIAYLQDYTPLTGGRSTTKKPNRDKYTPAQRQAARAMNMSYRAVKRWGMNDKDAKAYMARHTETARKVKAKAKAKKRKAAPAARRRAAAAFRRTF